MHQKTVKPQDNSNLSKLSLIKESLASVEHKLTHCLQEVGGINDHLLGSELNESSGGPDDIGVAAPNGALEELEQQVGSLHMLANHITAQLSKTKEELC
ncbi:hypothetical protein ACPV5U_08635 [Vibrio mediterranei]